MATKNNPGKFDCYERAEPDEPMFILLARDPAAAHAIREWMAARMRIGKNTIGDAQMNDALNCIYEMERWRIENR
jgi:hypothetical protein